MLLDVDGTLVDSAPAITWCLARAIESVGLDAPPVDVLAADIGPPLEDTLAAHGVAPAGFEAAKATYRSCYATEGLARSVLYPGIVEALSNLRSGGARLATATSKRVAMATSSTGTPASNKAKRRSRQYSCSGWSTVQTSCRSGSVAA